MASDIDLAYTNFVILKVTSNFVIEKYFFYLKSFRVSHICSLFSIFKFLNNNWCGHMLNQSCSVERDIKLIVFKICFIGDRLGHPKIPKIYSIE
jgi:hypothetical protein